MTYIAAMNFLWLEDIVALAAHGGFSRAAAARHVTQPAFSRRVRALEDWLGVELVDRSHQPVALTEAGRWFVGVARETLAAVARMPDDARAVADARAATIRIAATHALSLTFLPSWLRRFEGRLLAAPVELVSDVLSRGEDAMIDGRVQFLLCHAHPDVRGRLDGRCASVVVGRDVLVPVSAPYRGRPRHALDGARSVPLLANSAASGIGRIVAALRGPQLDAAGAATVFTADLVTVLVQMAVEGRGVAWLPRTLVADALRDRRLVVAAPPSWSIAIEVRLYRCDARLPAVADAFWDAVVAG